MKTLNYKHLRYFYDVARSGSIQASSRRLHVSPQAISAQIKQLETQLSQPLFDRRHRALRLSPAGAVALQYAERIFSTGNELHAALSDHPGALAIPLKVGVTDSVPKVMAARCLAPLVNAQPDRELVVHEGPLDGLMDRLVTGSLRVLLTDREPAAIPSVAVESELVIRSTMVMVGSNAVIDRLSGQFPDCLNNAPVILWEASSNLTSGLHAWFRARAVRPRVAARCVDSAFMKRLAKADVGLAAIPEHALEAVEAELGLRLVGHLSGVEMSLWRVQLAGQTNLNIRWPAAEDSAQT